ncbi:MAG TPA: NlpC/P60 family protein [Gaiellaceae bacterium]|nr:NlpC/P60 family protein [Gaiellaceae bacterium]
MPIPRTTVVALCALLATALLAGDLSAASPKQRLRQKRAQAAAVLAQVNTLDRQFEASVEAWNGARYELALTRKELVTDRARLRVAQQARHVAVARLEQRVRGLYEESDQPTTLGIFLGSSSVSELIDRIDAANTVAFADRQLITQTTAARARYAAAARRTAATARRRAVALEQRTRERRRIGALLGERKRLLSSVQSEVAKLQQEEAARQAKLAAEARARLAAERVAAAERARQQTAARAAEAEAARREREATTTVAAPPTTTAATTTAAADPPPAPATTTAAAPTPPPVPPSAGAGHPEAASIALRYLGVRYVWGGASPAGFDCSGLVMYVYAQLGIALPHYAAAQYQLGTPVARDQLQPGDLVFFDGLDHVGIYIGGGQVVHAPQTGDVVKISAIADWGAGYVGARRI